MADKNFISPLTGVRALCVYLIFFKHFDMGWKDQLPHLYLLLNQFYIFLSPFFVLSGFLIYYKYSATKSFDRKTIYNYIVSRITRVFPILLILVSISFSLAYREGIYNAAECIKIYLLNITLIKGFSSVYFLTGIGPSWSMSVEELFYILAPFIFFLVRKKTDLLKLVLFFYSVGLLITLIFHYVPAGGFFSDNNFLFNYTFFGRVFEFACGITLGMMLKGKSSFIKKKLSGKFALYAGAALVIACVISLYWISSNYNVDEAKQLWGGIFVVNICMPIGTVLVFYSLIYQKSLLQRFLGSRLMVELGNSTYSFYLLHTSFLISWIYKFISKDTFVVFGVVVIIAYAFHKLVEQPLANGLRKHLYKK